MSDIDLRRYRVAREVREVFDVRASSAAEAERLVMEADPSTLDRARSAGDGEVTFIEVTLLADTEQGDHVTR